jgi:hypothetical protein
MNLTLMRANVRRDLKDEDSGNYRWTDDELDRAIARALSKFSEYCPQEMKATLATVDGDEELDISSLTSRISIDTVEYPEGQSAKFSVYQDTLFFTETQGDGENCIIYYSAMHILDAGNSSIPTRHEDLVALGAAGIAALSMAEYSTNRANYGGANTDMDYMSWGTQRYQEFIQDCLKLKRKLKTNTLIAGG